jgi:hypothetical protein
MKFFARSNPDSSVWGTSINANLIVIVWPSVVVKSMISPPMTLGTVPPKFDEVVVTELEFKEIAQTRFEKVSVPHKTRKISILT